ncbi:tRNA (cytosine(49)-C(5))-methyltransferase [uncultured archaeon]|nr:tRNA (cytosine(49)-C(5))-methyltransferase [uncultured archaeon]
MTRRSNYEPKPLFLERMKNLLGKDFEDYMKILEREPVRSIRCNTLKSSPKDLKKRLEEKGWKIKIPFEDYPEIMIVENELAPGELGRALEHVLGYYYIQEIASMLPVLVLSPKEGERVLDLCASPGSKTTQIAARMKNGGLLIANEVKFGRIKILAANTERCGVTNMIMTRRDGIALCKRFKQENFLFDKILLDAPCSGEGTIRSTPATFEMWNIQTIENLSRLQKSLIASAIEILKPNGELVYSTCTHAPEEDEEILDFALKNFRVKIEKIDLPLKTRPGITKWGEKEYLEDVKYSCRVYPQDADTEGFFITKIRKLK